MTSPPDPTPFKEIHSLILDTGPIIANACSPTSLLQKAEVLITLPSVVSEIRDTATRSRFETIWKPFLTYRTPRPESVKCVIDFAKKTGDFSVLGVTDLQVLALAYEIDVERNGVDGRKRREAEVVRVREVQEERRRFFQGEKEKEKERQEKSGKDGRVEDEAVEGKMTAEEKEGEKKQHLNGEKNTKIEETSPEVVDEQVEEGREEQKGEEGEEEEEEVIDENEGEWTTISKKSKPQKKSRKRTKSSKQNDFVQKDEVKQSSIPQDEPSTETITRSLDPINLNDSSSAVPELDPEITTANSDNDDDEDDWITPDNLAQRVISDSEGTLLPPSTTQIPSACATTDFAMQNVLLQLNIYLFSPTSLARIATTKSHVLRCHACFKIVRDMSKQFCPSCGGPNLTRVACSTDKNGVFRVHLKKNWQWNNRGNVYSMSKPEHGSASGKGVKERLILVEDQKEYEKARKMVNKVKEQDLMDRDYLPGLLTGERLGHGNNVKIGAGRSVNGRKGTLQKVIQ